MDELDRRARSLQAERARPDVRDQTVEELLTRLIRTINAAFHTPPDGGAKTGTMAARIENFAELRSQGVSITTASGRVGVSVTTGRRYEALLGDRRREVSRRFHGTTLSDPSGESASGIRDQMHERSA